jgi:hypothetical protein
MKIILMIVGLLVLAMGLIWAGQGLGIVTWHPVGSPQSFMVNNKEWIYIGGATALAGLLILIWSRR